MPKPKRPSSPSKKTDSYQHPEAKSLLRPDVGTQAQFQKKKSPKKYKYDSSLSPNLEWDGQNSTREEGEALIRQILEAETLETAKSAAARLKGLSKPFLNWAGKGERISFDVPTLPLFVHERLSTKAIIETLSSHKKDTQQTLYDLFGDTHHSITDQVLRAYEHKDQWTNRMILGDSLVTMNSLLHYENLGGQVQMIYMDPPYGVKFGSNFQPFVRKRDVSHGDDEDMTREPEMVQAYRDTWELGLHSYLTYLRDRLLLSRELLTQSGSIFVQISDENLHHVCEVMDEVFGAENAIIIIPFVKTTSQTSNLLASVNDYLLWYSKDKAKVKYRPLFIPKEAGGEGGINYTRVQTSDGSRRAMTKEERQNPLLLPPGAKIFSYDNLTSSSGGQNSRFPVELEGKTYKPITGFWKTNPAGMQELLKARRVEAVGKILKYVRFFEDFPVMPLSNFWFDTAAGGFSGEKYYVVQSSTKVIERCLLMTTDPGDLVLDPTCGSGTTAYVAEQWGRRWITMDTSRVPLALARQRILTATFPWYELKDESRGPAGGFVYKWKQNKKGEEIGGIVPHITLKSIANNEPPGEEVLVDRPEQIKGISRVSGPFCVEATIPAPIEPVEKKGEETNVGVTEAEGSFVYRLLEALRKSPVLRLEGNKTVIFKNVRLPAKSLSLSAEALVTNGAEKPVAFVFGPENGAVSEKLVYEAAREAYAKNYTYLYVIGFAIQPNARMLIEKCGEVAGVSATYVQATPDLLMGDLLKNMRSSQIFSVCGLPEIEIHKTKEKKYQVELIGFDVFDPITMDTENRMGSDVPAWFLDTDYNDLCFHVTQAFFPRTNAWESIKKALKGDYEESVWDHLSGTTSAPFEPGEYNQIAVKVIDDRGNELVVVKKLDK